MTWQKAFLSVLPERKNAQLRCDDQLEKSVDETVLPN